MTSSLEAEVTIQDRVAANPIVRYSGILAGCSIILIALAVCYEILARYLLGHGTTWVFEASGYTLAWFTMLAGGYVLSQRRHIHVEVVVNRLTARTQALLHLVGAVIMLAYVGILAYFTLDLLVHALETDQRSPTPARVPMALVFGGMLLGLVVFTLQAVFTLVGAVAAFLRVRGRVNVVPLLTFAMLATGAVAVWGIAPVLSILLILFTLLFAGLPIFAVLGSVGSLGLYFMHGAEIGLGQTANLAFKAVNSNTLLAIPLFIIAGMILQKGGIGGDLYRVAASWLGSLRGGLGVATVVACGVFAAISGSSVATAGAIGLIAIPEMLRRGFEQKKVYGLMAAGGTLGILIPPSTAMILYSGMTNESTGQLFIGGVLPGIVLMAVFAAFIYFTSDRKHTTQAPATRAERIQALRRGVPGLLMPVIVLVGIYFGIFTAPEAASVALIYAIIVTLAQKRLSWKSLPAVLREGTLNSGMITMIIVGAIILGDVITLHRIPNMLIELVKASNLPTVAVMLTLVIGYVILGMFLEVVSVMLITLPIVYPLVTSLGVDGLWFGIFLVILMELSLLTPPVGLNLFVIKDIARAPLSTVVRGTIPYFALLILGLLIITVFPWLVTWLPSQIY